MILTTLEWSFFSWLFVGACAAATSFAIVGDLNPIYWVPLLARDAWMMRSTLLMSATWLVAYVATAIAHWFVWKDNGGWTGAIGPLIVGFSYVLACLAWHATLYLLHEIRAAFWLSVAASVLAVATTVWFWILGTVPGVIMLFVLVWTFYVSLWSFQLARLNTVNGRVRKTGGATTSLCFQPGNAGLPAPDAWGEVSRACPYGRQHRKFTSSAAGKRGEGGGWEAARTRRGDAVAASSCASPPQQQQQQQQPATMAGADENAPIASRHYEVSPPHLLQQQQQYWRQQQQHSSPSQYPPGATASQTYDICYDLGDMQGVPPAAPLGTSDMAPAVQFQPIVAGSTAVPRHGTTRAEIDAAFYT